MALPEERMVVQPASAIASPAAAKVRNFIVTSLIVSRI
jgi:hypothetical protein